MKAVDPKFRRRLALVPAPEGLETRQVLSGGAGNTIAIMPANITDADKPAVIEFTMSPESFSSTRGTVLLGIDTVATSQSTAKPKVTGIATATGAKVQFSSHTGARALVIGGQPVTPAMVARIKLPSARKGAPVTPAKFNVAVKGQEKTTGPILAGFYLVGDADGNGRVDREDIKAIRNVLGTTASDSAYQFDADANRDGRITAVDMQLAQQNLGARTKIMPLISADIDGTTADVTTRTSSKPEVKLQGVASSGATIAYASTHTQPITTTADDTGNYQITVPLVEGSNTFTVTSTDSFGQTISGTIAAITYKPLSTT